MLLVLRMTAMARILILFLIALMAMTAAKAQEAPIRYLHSVSPDGYHEVAAKELGRPFHIYVRLPDDYARSKDRYPVIYLLDGGFTYPMLAAYFRLLSIDEKLPNAILVGVSYGAEGFENGNYRGTDFTAPSEERDHWGGASAFQRFLKNELLPFVAERYRTDENRRVLFGQSLGGQFAVYSAMTDPDLFWGRIANNPALHRNLQFFMDIEPAPPQGDTHLVVTTSTEEAAEFREPSQRWVRHWTTERAAPFQITVVEMPGERHAAATPIAFRAGLRRLFPTNTQDGNEQTP